MKKWFLVCTISLLSIFYTKAQDSLWGYKEGYYLIWHDEFGDESTTFNLWDRVFPWGPFAGDYTYSKAYGNHEFHQGALHLVNRKEFFNGEVSHWDSSGNYAPYYRDFEYTSAMLYSKQQFLNGYFETRFNSDVGAGFFNAFWLYGQEDQEIDVFELAGSLKNDAQMTLHWRGKDPLTNSSQSISHMRAPRNFDQGWHVFGVEWSAQRLQWLYNHQPVPESGFTRFIRGRHIPDKPMSIIVNSSVATQDGLPDSNTPLPGKIAFDYVRAYRQDTIVEAPVIVGHSPMTYLGYAPLTLSHELLEVEHPFGLFPYGFELRTEAGEHYTVEERNVVRVEQGWRDTVWLNVRVSDGMRLSEVYSWPIAPDQTLGLTQQKNKPTMKYNGESQYLEWVGLDGDDWQLVLTNSLGQTLLEAPLGVLKRFYLNHFLPGWYAVRLTSAGKAELVYSLILTGP
ncbi:MAG TPA: glycoside hydrolase family 16 protein [Luteibaculaceae bacterium]|nr:glycoside hydrolase family 16 protein [Luteibaculaceae bacterium]